jgi:hypothetical protein
MRGCARSCLLQLLLWAAITAAVQFYLRSAAPARAEVWPFSLAIGLAASMAIVLAHAVLRTSRERKMLTEAAAGTTPADGAWVAVSGPITSRTPVRGPISGEVVVAYEYKIERDERLGRSTTPVLYYDGKALSESTIATAQGPIRLLTVPTFEMEPADVRNERAVANATEYIHRTTFANRETGAARTANLEKEWTDDDGVFRIDNRRVGSDVDLNDRFRLAERQIRQNEPVCVFGVYSAERRGLVPDERWGRPARLMRGTASDAARALSGRVVRYTIGALLLAGGAAGGVVVYLRQFAV